MLEAVQEGELGLKIEAQGLSWAWRELASGFGIYAPQKNVWDAPVVRALLGSRVTRG